MAKPVSEEELQLNKRARRRLIGAIALVAAVAAILPMVLDSEPKPTSGEVNIQIPPPGTKDKPVPKASNTSNPSATAAKAQPPARTETKTVDAPTAPAVPSGESQPAEKQKPGPAIAPQSAPVKPAEKASPAVATGTTDKALAQAIEKATGRGEAPVEKASLKAAEKSEAHKAVPGSFFIQVVALADTEKARQTQQKMQSAGVRAYTETVTTGSSKVTRVRAGPFATREEADMAQAKLQGMGLEGKVATY